VMSKPKLNVRLLKGDLWSVVLIDDDKNQILLLKGEPSRSGDIRCFFVKKSIRSIAENKCSIRPY
jgi:hypothetical protein